MNSSTNIVEPPSGLGADASAYWVVLCPELSRRGAPTEAATSLLAQACEALALADWFRRRTVALLNAGADAAAIHRERRAAERTLAQALAVLKVLGIPHRTVLPTDRFTLGGDDAK